MVRGKWLVVMGLALALPSTLLGTFALLFSLVKKGYLSETWGLVLMVLVGSNTLYLMVRYVAKRKKRS